MTKKILIFVPKGVELMELSPFIDVFGWANTHGKIQVDFSTYGFTEKVDTTFGLSFHVEKTFSTVDQINVSEFSGLAIPGGFENYGFFDDAFDERLLELVKLFHKEKKPIATVCVASFILAKSGVLVSKKGTTYNLLNGRKQKQLATMGVNVLDQPLVMDDNLITSRGPSAAPFVAFQLLELVTSKEEALRVKELMCF